MIRTAVVLSVLVALPVLAEPINLEIGERKELGESQALRRITVRDPSLLDVEVVDGVVSIVGRKSGVTAVSFRNADGLLTKELVFVNGSPTSEMRGESERSFEVESAGAVSASPQPTPAERKGERARGAVEGALEVTQRAAHSTL